MRVTPKQKVNKVLNFLHRGFVYTCVGVTIWSTSILGYNFFRYMFVTRPKFVEQRKLSERSLLAEGSSDKLEDSAPDITQ